MTLFQVCAGLVCLCVFFQLYFTLWLGRIDVLNAAVADELVYTERLIDATSGWEQCVQQSNKLLEVVAECQRISKAFEELCLNGTCAAPEEAKHKAAVLALVQEIDKYKTAALSAAKHKRDHEVCESAKMAQHDDFSQLMHKYYESLGKCERKLAHCEADTAVELERTRISYNPHAPSSCEQQLVFALRQWAVWKVLAERFFVQLPHWIKWKEEMDEVLEAAEDGFVMVDVSGAPGVDPRDCRPQSEQE